MQKMSGVFKCLISLYFFLLPKIFTQCVPDSTGQVPIGQHVFPYLSVT